MAVYEVPTLDGSRKLKTKFLPPSVVTSDVLASYTLSTDLTSLLAAKADTATVATKIGSDGSMVQARAYTAQPTEAALAAAGVPSGTLITWDTP